MERFSRTELLIGSDGLQKLKNARVAVFGVGGVGGYVVEALARSGIGGLTLIDPDKVSISNLNRQIVALMSTVGQYKTHAAKARVLDISPECNVETLEIFYMPETDCVDFSTFDYVVDAVDTVSAKLAIIQRASAANVPVISAMGAGNKLFPERFEIADISKTQVCPLARAVRKKLKEAGVVSGVKVVYSKEPPVPTAYSDAVGSVSFTPSIMGLLIAGQVIKDLAENH